MTRLTMDAFLSLLQRYLQGKCDFATVREWVYRFYEGEECIILDDALEEIFPIILSYLQYEEAEEDPKRDKRMRRLYNVLNDAHALFSERAVFGLEFDEIRELTRKYANKVITHETYANKMAALSPAPYDASRLVRWANAQINDDEPIPTKLT